MEIQLVSEVGVCCSSCVTAGIYITIDHIPFLYSSGMLMFPHSFSSVMSPLPGGMMRWRKW